MKPTSPSPEEFSGDFVEAFEAGLCVELDHEDHVRLAWLYLERYSFGIAGDRLNRSLREPARSKGNEEVYHATLTWAFLAIIQERRRRKVYATFDDFLGANQDLVDRGLELIGEHYKPEDLSVPLAREIFVLPKRQA